MNTTTPSERRSIRKDFWQELGRLKAPDDLLPKLQENPWLMYERAPEGTGAPEDSPCTHALAHERAWRMVDFCIDQGAPLEARDKSGHTLLHALASKTGYSSFAKEEDTIWRLASKALSLGARCDTVSSSGEPLWFLRGGHLPAQWTEIFLNKGSPPGSSSTEGVPHLTLLTQAAVLDDRAFRNLELVLHHGGNPNAMGVSMDSNPLWNALSGQAQIVVELLMRHGADPHVKDRFGRGILHHARSAMTVSWMAGQGVAIDDRDALGQTPLLFAMLDDVKQKSCDREQALIELVVRGAQLDSSDHQGPAFSSSPEKLLASKSKSLWPNLPMVLKSMDARSKAYAALDEIDHPSP